MSAVDHLLKTNAYIDGLWQEADDGGRFPVVDPATGGTIATVPDMGAAETGRAIEAAGRALPGWSARTARDRARMLRALHDLMLENREALARIVTTECGKPLAEARSEVAYAAAFLEWFAEEGKRIYGDIIPSPASDRRILVTRQPVGICGLITPWNFPMAMVTRKLGPALAAGCTTVLKPAEATPFSALALGALAARAGMPAGVFNIVTASSGARVGDVLCAHPQVRKISFTGSTAVGKALMRQSAGTVKTLSLELGGNAPFIIFDDADLDAAVAGALASKFRNSGQTCVCVNRFLVQDGVYDAFAGKLRDALGGLKVGHGLDEGVSQGPLIDRAGLAKVERHVADALAKGARLLCGGRPHALGGGFYEPTILLDATPDMIVAREETFGPVACLFRFGTEEEAVRMANDTEYGLAAYFYSRDAARCWRVSERLDYGIVGVNEGIVSTEVAPFGGIKESGLGREGSRYGIEDYLDIKYVCVGGLGPIPGSGAALPPVP